MSRSCSPQASSARRSRSRPIKVRQGGWNFGEPRWDCRCTATGSYFAFEAGWDSWCRAARFLELRERRKAGTSRWRRKFTQRWEVSVICCDDVSENAPKTKQCEYPASGSDDGDKISGGDTRAKRQHQERQQQQNERPQRRKENSKYIQSLAMSHVGMK